jgi:hypothetical protein
VAGDSNKRISDAVFQDVVADLANEEQGVTLEEARATLAELNLPADKLEQAADRVRQRHAGEVFERMEKMRRMLLLAGACVIATLAIVGVLLYRQRQAAERARITAIAPQLIQEANQLKLSVKLMDTPKDESVSMTCTWQTLDGTLLHQNAWQTKPVNHDAWETHCVLDNAPEHVKVEMRAYGRVVAMSSK